MFTRGIFSIFVCARFTIIDVYDKDVAVVETEIDRVRAMIDQRHMDFVHLIENEKNILLLKIEDYLKSMTSKWVLKENWNGIEGASS